MVSQTGAIHTSVSRSMNKLNTTKHVHHHIFQLKQIFFPNLLSTECWDLRNRQVTERRIVVTIIIVTIKLLGKQGLLGRAHWAEALHAFINKDLNHENFLEIIKETAIHNDILNRHLKNCALISKEKANNDDKGRGSFVSFLNSSTYLLLNWISYSIWNTTNRNFEWKLWLLWKAGGAKMNSVFKIRAAVGLNTIS